MPRTEPDHTEHNEYKKSKLLVNMIEQIQASSWGMVHARLRPRPPYVLPITFQQGPRSIETSWGMAALRAAGPLKGAATRHPRAI